MGELRILRSDVCMRQQKEFAKMAEGHGCRQHHRYLITRNLGVTSSLEHDKGHTFCRQVLQLAMKPDVVGTIRVWPSPVPCIAEDSSRGHDDVKPLHLHG